VLAGTFDERLSGFGNEGCPGLANASKYGKVKKTTWRLSIPNDSSSPPCQAGALRTRKESVCCLYGGCSGTRGSIPSRRRRQRNRDHG